MKNDFINTLHSSSFYPTINLPTRVTATSKTVIDNIITNVQNSQFNAGVLLTDITDHFPVVLYSNVAQKGQVPHYTKTRLVNERTLYRLTMRLHAKDWNTVFCCEDPDTAYNTLANEITNSIIDTVPLKSNTRCRLDQKPWLTKGLSISIKHKNKLYQKYLKHPNLENKNKYYAYRNKLTHLIRKSKSSHYFQLINASKGNSKKSWQVINSVLNRGNKQHVLPDPGNTTHTDLADNLNNYFVSIGENLSKKITQPQGNSFNQYLTGNYVNSLSLSEAYKQR